MFQGSEIIHDKLRKNRQSTRQSEDKVKTKTDFPPEIALTRTWRSFHEEHT